MFSAINRNLFLGQTPLYCEIILFLRVMVRFFYCKKDSSNIEAFSNLSLTILYLFYLFRFYFSVFLQHFVVLVIVTNYQLLVFSPFFLPFF